MNKKVTAVAFIIVLGFILFVYRNWFGVHEIIGGDWPYFFPETVKAITLPPPVFVFWQQNGLGGIDPVRGLRTFESFLAVAGVQWLGLPWPVVYKVGWFGLFLMLSFVSSTLLWRKVFPGVASRWPAALAGLIYTTNSYILMVTGGGQMGVALSYSLAPIVLASFIKLLRYSFISDQNVKYQMSNVKCLLITGLALGIQLMIDPRIAYVTMVGVTIYIIFNFQFSIFNLFRFLVVPLLIVVFLNAFWILPMAVMRENPFRSLGSAYTSAESLKFFSFADFSHALSLLHPNWPENIFGKTYFLKPEFLVMPIIAFGSIIFLKKQLNILYFALLALLGVFLAKGVNEPFGGVYIWLFEHVPGFVMFRDPTKWYILVAISYSVLIPYTMSQVVSWRRISNQELRIMGNAVVTTIVIFFWLLTIRQAVFGKLGGTFARHTVPQEYIALKDFFIRKPEFFRTLWVPRQSRFAFSSALHPAVEAQPLFGATSSAMLLNALHNVQAREKLASISIRYVIVPSDSLGEIFVEDRRYDDRKRQAFVNALDQIPWFKKLPASGISLYQVLPSHALQ